MASPAYPNATLYPGSDLFPADGGESAPTVVTGTPTVTGHSVLFGGTVTTENALEVYDFFQWRASGLASWEYTSAITDEGIGPGTFYPSLAETLAGGGWVVRLVAYNTVGTTYGNEVSFSIGNPLITVREKPPLRQQIMVETPTGQVYRWGEDETNGELSFSGLNYGDGMPGGYDQMGATLPRKTQQTYSDLEPFSNIQVQGVGGEITWEGRLERTPKVAGDEFHIDPDAVGWQAHLEDNKNCTEIYIDRAFANWEGIAPERKNDLYDLGYEVVEDGSVEPSPSGGRISLPINIAGTAEQMTWEYIAESWYDAGPGGVVAQVDYTYGGKQTVAGFNGRVGISDDELATTVTQSGDLLTGVDTAGTATLTDANDRRYGYLKFEATGAYTTGAGDHWLRFHNLKVWGDHGLDQNGGAGVLASDVVEYIVSTSGWCPELSVGTIDTTDFVIPQLEFRTPTTPAEMIKQANRFHLFDWFIGPGKKFHYRQRGTYGRTWLARVGPARLEEQGLAADRCITHVLVSYQDVDGTPKYVGPVGSGADTEDASLEDIDTQNPAVAAGLERWATLSMDTSTPAGAIQVGSRFLDEFKLVNYSGRAELVGWVMDDKGVTHPYSSVTAGDEIVFLDAADTSPRRIVKTSKNHSSRAVAVDLDAPPEGTQALLERLGVGLVNFGQVAAPAPPKRDPTKYYPASSFPGPDPIGLPI